MLLGVVSDSHANIKNVQAAVRLLESLEVSQVLHCGDIGSEEVIPYFTPWPTHYVFGNVDYDTAPLKRAMQAAGHTCHDRFGSLQMGGRSIAFLHGDDTRRLHDEINSGQWDMVCHGHTHQKLWTQVGPTWVLNPGALHRANPFTLAVVELETLTTTHVPLY